MPFYPADISPGDAKVFLRCTHVLGTFFDKNLPTPLFANIGTDQFLIKDEESETQIQLRALQNDHSIGLALALISEQKRH